MFQSEGLTLDPPPLSPPPPFPRPLSLDLPFLWTAPSNLWTTPPFPWTPPSSWTPFSLDRPSLDRPNCHGHGPSKVRVWTSWSHIMKRPLAVCARTREAQTRGPWPWAAATTPRGSSKRGKQSDMLGGTGKTKRDLSGPPTFGPPPPWTGSSLGPQTPLPEVHRVWRPRWSTSLKPPTHKPYVHRSKC